MELDDAIHTAILTLKEGYEGQISANNIEIGIIRSDREFKYDTDLINLLLPFIRFHILLSLPKI
jgi:20S proteasome alpha/beta subunit